MVGMTSLPIRQNDYARLLFPYDSRYLKPVFPRVLHSAIGNIECAPPACFQNLGCFFCLTGTIFRRPARTHFTLSKIENPRPMAKFGHFEQSAATSLLYVVTVSSYGKNIKREGHSGEVSLFNDDILADD